MLRSRRGAPIAIAVVAPPDPLGSTLHGVVEFFTQANRLRNGERFFQTTLVTPVGTPAPPGCDRVFDYARPPRAIFDALIVCPAYGPPEPTPLPNGLKRFLLRQKSSGTWLTSVCAGAFVLGSAGLLDGHRVTTHWALADTLQSRCPRTRVDADSLTIEDGQVMTAAGATAWMDLVLHLAACLGSPELASALGKFYLADTAPREQRCYRVFSPRDDHGCVEVSRAEAVIRKHFGEALTVEELAQAAGMSVRNFQRRFKEATGFAPQAYLKRFRVQRACGSLESSKASIEAIIDSVGYTDTSAVRKAFREVTGLSPTAYRKRFQLAAVAPR